MALTINMKTMLIEVPINGNITNYELERARCNRMEYTSGMKIPIPKINKQLTKLKLKEGAGLWSFITGCLP